MTIDQVLPTPDGFTIAHNDFTIACKRDTQRHGDQQITGLFCTARTAGGKVYRRFLEVLTADAVLRDYFENRARAWWMG